MAFSEPTNRGERCMHMDAVRKAVRTRRPFKKSLFGCRNCKIRRVKCDETKPQCRNCNTYGVVCTYVSNTPDLQVSTSGPRARINSGKHVLSTWALHDYADADDHLQRLLYTSLKPGVYCSDGTNEFRMDGQCFAGLERFRFRVTSSYSKRTTRIWRDNIPHLAFRNPYLMHTLLAVAAAHERQYDMGRYGHKSMIETYHTARATHLFNQKLSSHLISADYDPLWASAALLGLLSCAAVDSTPQNAWPLTPPSSSDLEWFILSDGKRAVWNLTDPLRPSSIFSSAAQEYVVWDAPIPASGVGTINPQFASLCGITESSTPQNNPYFATVHVLAIVLPLRLGSDPDTHGQMKKPEAAGIERVTFVAQPQAQCLELLKRRDKVALVLLALWYEWCGDVYWWFERRARVEGRAIRLFLEQNYPHDKAIFELLSDMTHERDVFSSAAM